MSSVDEKVVELQFKNRQFEEGVKESIGSLEKLKESLNLESSAKSLKYLGDAGRRFDLSGVADNIEQVAKRTSLAQTFIHRTFEKAADDVYAWGKRMLTQVPDLIIKGGKARAEKITQAKFMLEGLLGPEKFKEQWEQIDEDINEGVRDTAYGYDAAAMVAAQLSASNISFGKDMQTALKGVSGVAAMTNSSFEEIGHIFTTIAGRGKLMTEQLNQFSYRGLNAAATLADYLHKDEATIRDMVTKGKIDFKTFSEAMNDAFGKQAKMANKTLTGALSNIKASFSRMGEGFATPTLEALRQILVGPDINETTGLLRVLKDIEGMLKPLADTFTLTSESVVKAVNGMLDSIHAVIGPLGSFGKLQHAAFVDMRKAATALTQNSDALEDTAEGYDIVTKDRVQYVKGAKNESTTLRISKKSAEDYVKVLDELGVAYKVLETGEVEFNKEEARSASLKKSTSSITGALTGALKERVPILGKLLKSEKEEAKTAKETAETYESIETIAKDVILGKYGNGEERKKKLEELGLSYAVIQNKVNELLGCSKRYKVTAEEEAKTMQLLGKSTSETGEKTEKSVSIFEKLINIIGGIRAGITIVKDAAKGLWTNLLGPFLKNTALAIFGAVTTALSNIGKALIDLSNKIPDGFFDKKFKDAADTFKKIGDSFGNFVEKVKGSEAVKKLSEAFTKLGDAISGFFSSGVETISGLFGQIGDAAEKGINFDWAIPIIENLSGVLTAAVNSISAGLGAVWPRITDFGLSLKNLFETLKNNETVQKFIATFEKLRTSVSNFVRTGFERITEFFSNLGKGSEEGGNKLSWLAGVLEKISGALTWFMDKISGVTDKIADFVSTKFTTENFENFKKSITDFIEKAKSSKPVQDLMTAMSNLATAIRDLFNAGFEKIDDELGKINEEGEKGEGKFDWLMTIVGAVSAVLTKITELGTTIVNKLGPTITSIGESLKAFFAKEENAKRLETLTTSFTNLQKAISAVIDLGLNNLIEKFSALGESEENTKAEGWQSIFSGLADSITLVIDSITNLLTIIQNNGGNIRKSIKEWFDNGGLFETGKDAAKTLVEGLVDGFGTLLWGPDVFSSGESSPLAGVAAALEKEEPTLKEKITIILKRIGQAIKDAIRSFIFGDEVFAAEQEGAAGTNAGGGIAASVGNMIESEMPSIKDVIFEKLGMFGGLLQEGFSKLDFNSVLKGLRIGAFSYMGLKIGGFFGKMGKTVKIFNNLFKSNGKSFGENTKNVFDSIAGLFTGLKENLSSNNTRLFDSLIGVPEKLNVIIGGIGDVMKSKARDYNATAALKIALVIGILLGAIFLLSKYADAEKLGAIVGAITPLVVALAAIIGAIALLRDKMNAAKALNMEDENSTGKALNKLSEGLNGFLDGLKDALAKALKLAGIGVAFAGIGAALLMVAFAIGILSKIPMKEASQRALILLGFIATMAAAAVVMSKYAENFKAGMGIGLLGMALAVLALVKALEFLGNMKEEKLIQGILALTGILALLATTAATVTKFVDAKKLIGFAAGCMILSIALTALLVPILAYSVIPFEILASGLIKIGGALGLLILAAHAASGATPGFIAMATSMLAISAGVVLLGAGLVAVSIGLQVLTTALIGIGPLVEDNLGAFAKGLIAMVVVLGTFIALGALATVVAPGLIALSLVMISFAAAMYLLSAAMGQSPEMAEFMSGAFEGLNQSIGDIFGSISEKFYGMQDTIRSFVDNIPVVGDLFNKVFPKSEGQSVADQLAEEFNLDPGKKRELREKIEGLLKLEGEDFSVEIGNVLAWVDDLKLPPGQAAALKSKLLLKVAQAKSKDAKVTFDEVYASITKATVPDSEKKKIFDEIRAITADENMTAEQKQVAISKITAKIDSWVAQGDLDSEAAESLKSRINEYINNNDAAKEATMTAVTVMLESFEVTGAITEEQSKELEKKIDDLIGIAGEGDSKKLNHAINEIAIYCKNIGLDDATTRSVVEAAKRTADLYTQTIGERIAENSEHMKQTIEEAQSGIGEMKFTVAPGSQIENALIYQNLDKDIDAFTGHILDLLRDKQMTADDLFGAILPPEGTSQEEWTQYLRDTLYDGSDKALNELTFDDLNLEGFKSLFAGSDLFYNSGMYVDEGVAKGIKRSKMSEAAIKYKSHHIAETFDNELGIYSPSKVFMTKGMYIVLGLAKGITTYTRVARAAIIRLVSECLKPINDKIGDFRKAGGNLGEAFANGIKSKGSQAKASARVMAGEAIKGLQSKVPTDENSGAPYSSGKNFTKGFANGIKDDLAVYAVKQASKHVAETAMNTVDNVIKTGSPARELIKRGKFFSMGFAIGISQFADKSYSAAHDMATGAVEALRNPLATVRDILSGDLEVDPTIRPVMDLSEIQNGVNTINAMSPAMAVGIGSISASMNRRKVDTNEEVIAAIQSLKEGMDRPSNTYNVNGVTYDDGSNVSDAVRGLIRAARIERRR